MNNQKLYEAILNKTLNFLAYSQRSRKEVVDRINTYLYKKNLLTTEKEEIKVKIMEEVDNLKLLDDKVYAKMYVEGKIRSKKPVSKRKLTEFLYKKGIGRGIIEETLSTYNKNDERELIKDLITKKLRSIKDTDSRVIKRKLASYILGKGFAPEQVFEELEKHFNKSS
ncbi:MAG: hypothetical protein ACD_22C00180G0002 [uncultured bacterium]|nr:MAG: hypothetical protein ACD_22C00180G0002 [uncultured bacterium]